MKGVLLFLAVAAATTLGVAIGWQRWLVSRAGTDESTWRHWVGFASLLGCSAQILAFLLFEVVIVADDRMRYYSFLGRIEFCLFVVVLISAVVGKGRTRWPAVVSAAGTIGFWILLGMSM
jgi:hypothetical protein